MTWVCQQVKVADYSNKVHQYGMSRNYRSTRYVLVHSAGGKDFPHNPCRSAIHTFGTKNKKIPGKARKPWIVDRRCQSRKEPPRPLKLPRPKAVSPETAEADQAGKQGK